MAKSNKAFPNINALSKLALAVFCANSALVIAGPTGDSVAAGTANIVYNGSNTTINQSSDVVTIDWATFNVGINETVVFNQASSNVAINNIHDTSASSILGSITAGGTVFLSNSNGFIFGANSSINTGAFLATTSDIDFNGTDNINLADNLSLNSSISIHKDANIDANQNSEGGYLAFISRSVITDSSDPALETNSNPGLHAENGEVLISNSVTSTIKLSGLNINFPDSSFTEPSNFDLNLSDVNISAKEVILTSSGLTDILNSVVNQPASITTDNLIVSSSNLGLPNTISDSIYNTINTGKSEHLDIDTLTVNNIGSLSNTDSIDITKNIDIKNGSNLVINSDTIFFESNVSGSGSNLTLNAKDVKIGYFSQGFGDFNGLKNLIINAETTSLFGNIHTTKNLFIDGKTTVYRESSADNIDVPYQTKLISDNGNITLGDSLTFGGAIDFDETLVADNTGDPYDLYVNSNNISLAEVSGFGSIDLNANKVILSGNIKSTEAISIKNKSDDYVDIHLTKSIELQSNNIEFEDFYLTSTNETNDLTLHTLGSGLIQLINSTKYSGSDSNLLDSLIIKNNDASNTEMLISGNFDTKNLTIYNKKIFNLELDDDTLFSNIDSLNVLGTTLTGKYLFSATGGNSESIAQLGSISNLEGVKLTGFNQTTLNNHISTQGLGLLIESDSIVIDDSLAILSIEGVDTNVISISNSNGGKITLDGAISSADSNLSINTQNSDLYLGSIIGLENLTINKQLKDEGSTQLTGNISVSGNVLATNLGSIFTNNIAITADNITITDSHIDASNSDITIDANATESSSINIDSIEANNIELNADVLNLYGDLNASGELTFLDGSATKEIDMALMNDLTLSGNVDFLSTNNTQVNITGDKNLSINSSNTDIHLTTFDTVGELNSLSITASNNTDFPSNLFFDLNDGLFTMPELNGAQGLSLLGDMLLNVGESQVFDTSGYNGNLNLSGVQINGLGTLTFDTGTGELSLGDIGTNPILETDIFTSLVINSTGKLNLHGELNITPDAGYDFSNLNSIDLYTDLILGSADALLTKIDFGSASINGTHDLTLYTPDLTLGSIGNNIAIQDLTIVGGSNLSLTDDITVVGTININSTGLSLDNQISSTGLDVNITTESDLVMSKDSTITANSGGINLVSTSGNVGIGSLTADTSVNIRSEQGYLYNNINDYISNDSTSVNITSTDLNLYGLTNIGESVASPIVIDVQNSGTINVATSGTAYIANLANANVESQGRFIDSSTGGSTASNDANTQFNLASLNIVNLPTVNSTLGLISNLTWRVDDEDSIRKIKSPASAPAIYYSRYGWRLGQK
ncbi:MAG: filamentous hemagglutinin family protein [Crocinitomicaceae bacterium]